MKFNITRALVMFCAVIAIVGGGKTAWAQDDDQGATRGFFASPQIGGWASVALDQQFRDIQRLSLPPGRYVANATAQLASGDPNFHGVSCLLRVGDLIVSDAMQGLIGGGVNNFVTLPLTFAFTIRTTQNLAVACATENSGLGIVSQPSPITAIRVDRLTIQNGFQP